MSSVDVTDAHRGPLDVSYQEILVAESSACVCEWMDSEDPFLLIYTSGTTGAPKGSVHVHGGFLAKISQEVAHQADLREDDLLYWFSDMGWIMGPWEVVGALALGGSIFLYEGAPDFPHFDRIWEQVARHRVTILGVSPTLVRSLMRHGDQEVERHDLTSLRILGSTGEAWNEAPWQWFFQKVGRSSCPVINFSGGTEVGACLVSPLPCLPIKPCSVGGPSLGMAVDVVNPTGDSVRGQVGELICRKPWPGMTRGLWGDPDRFVQTYWPNDSDVWVHGDWASIDEDGQWFLHGRSDDTLNIAGKRLGPAEIESIVVSHPSVVEAAAVGLPDPIKGEHLALYVVLGPLVEPSGSLKTQLRGLLVQSLGKSFTPEVIRFVPDLPKTRSAKVMRRVIRSIAMGLEPGDVSSLENPSSLDGLISE